MPAAQLAEVTELGERLRRSVSAAVEVSEQALDVILATLRATRNPTATRRRLEERR